MKQLLKNPGFISSNKQLHNIVTDALVRTTSSLSVDEEGVYIEQAESAGKLLTDLIAALILRRTDLDLADHENVGITTRTDF